MNYLGFNFLFDSTTTIFLLINNFYHNAFFEIIFLLRIYQMLEIAKNIADYW